MAFGDLDCLADLPRRPFARAPVQRLAARHDVAHRPHGFLDRRLRVGAVAVHDVDEVEPETLQRTVDRLQQVLAVEGVRHVDGVVDAPEQLRRHEVRPPWPAEPAQRLAHDRLATAAGVRLGVVEEVAPSVVGGLHALHRGVDGDLGVERHPRPERQHRHLDASPAQPAVLHVGLLSHDRRSSRRSISGARCTDLVRVALRIARGSGQAATGRTVTPRSVSRALAAAIVCWP